MNTDSQDFRIETTWQALWAKSLRTAEDLNTYGFISPEELPHYQALLSQYRFTLPLYYARLIDQNNPSCPIRRQAIPTLEELARHPNDVDDPLQDKTHQPAPRITHRYPDRVLFHLTANCSMDCRFCFRKFFLNEGKKDLFAGEVLTALNYLRAHEEIAEVIFSGGDPFMASDDFLREMIQALDQMPHLKRIRFHTRVPVTFPMRVTEDLVASLASSKIVVVVTHFNHPKELTAETRLAAIRLQSAGVRMLNQSVLLKGVNDDADVLKALSEKLFEDRIVPYYLHHPDPAAGTRHFGLRFEEGLPIYHALQAKLSGYLVPRYVVDDPSAPFKTPVSRLLLS